MERVDAWRWLLRAHAATLPAIEADLARAGVVKLAWYDVLLELDNAPERRLRMTQLGQRVTLSRSRVSRIVDELVREGLVERVADADDRRASFAVLTAAGRRALRRAAPLYLDSVERHFSALLEDHEREVVARALHKVASHHEDR